MTAEFIKAFNHSMHFEIGPHFDPIDEDVINGAIDTKVQRRKVGFTDIRADRGGITKYGVAQNSHPNISVKNLNLQSAMEIYEEQYWTAGRCDELQGIVSLFHFDACVNHGVGRAAKFLQRAAGVAADGVIGPGTLATVSTLDPTELATKMLDQREAFFNRIVENDPTQQKFLNGWMARIASLRALV